MSSTAADKSSGNAKGQEEIVQGFRVLREQQQHILAELKTTEGNLREIFGVINALKKFDQKGTALYRLGDILVETNIDDHYHDKVELFNNLSNEMKKLNSLLITKSEELANYQKTNNIRVLTEQEVAELEQKNIIQSN
uniref:Prefoldin subunit 2 n=1 Tax=Panagrolaimus sp. PS1159 TaxID=55785 RepID=A0AC35GCL7_9BILA